MAKKVASVVKYGDTDVKVVVVTIHKKDDVIAYKGFDCDTYSSSESLLIRR